MYSEEKFTDLAEQYIDTVFRVALSYLKSRADADDVTQEVFLRLYERNRAFESGEHLKNWLIRVAINQCKKLLRSPWRRTVPIDDYANTLPFESPESGEAFRAVMTMEARYRTVLNLYYYEGYSIREIAGLLGISESTVGTRLARGRDRLRNILTEAEQDD